MSDLPESYDYRVSHTTSGKGQSYNNNFEFMAWRRYVWHREQCVLDNAVRTHFANKPIRHLDFACGTGRILNHLAGRAEISTGIDVSESMLELARRKVTSAEIIKADLTETDVLGDRSFNLITAFRFFPNAQPLLRKQVINCLSKHLASDGLLIFNNHQNHTSLRYQIARLRGRQWRTMSSREVRQLLSSTGLTIDKVFPIGVLPAVDGHMLVPSCIHRLLDSLLNTCRVGHILAQNLVYICRNTP